MTCRLKARRPLRAWLLFFVSSSVIGLAGCSSSSKPDWQSFTDDSGRYTISFPGKTTLDTQTIDVNGMSLPLNTRSASGDNTVFAVGAVTLPSADPTIRDAALASIEQGIARNAGNVSSPQDVAVTAADGRKLSGHQWQATGTVPGTQQKRAVLARFFATNTQAYELVIVGKQLPPQEAIDRFFSAFKPL